MTTTATAFSALALIKLTDMFNYNGGEPLRIVTFRLEFDCLTPHCREEKPKNCQRRGCVYDAELSSRAGGGGPDPDQIHTDGTAEVIIVRNCRWNGANQMVLVLCPNSDQCFHQNFIVSLLFTFVLWLSQLPSNGN
jgi:hypothetical protein